MPRAWSLRTEYPLPWSFRGSECGNGLIVGHSTRATKMEATICRDYVTASTLGARQFEAPSERKTQGLNSRPGRGANRCWADTTSACCEIEAIELVCLEDRSRRAACRGAGIYRARAVSRGKAI